MPLHMRTFASFSPYPTLTIHFQNSFEAEGDFDDEDIRNILMEAILLENELEETYDKREKLLTYKI